MNKDIDRNNFNFFVASVKRKRDKPSDSIEMYHGISQAHDLEVYKLPQLTGRILACCHLLSSSTVHKKPSNL